MDFSKRRLRPRAKSTIERVIIDPVLRDANSQSPTKPNLKRASPSLNKENLVKTAIPNIAKPNSKRSKVKPLSIPEKGPLNKENQLENLPEVVIRNCKLTNTLFELHKKFEEKCEDVRLNGQFCATSIENIKLKQELHEKQGEIERLKKMVENFENEKCCQDLIQFDDSNAETIEGLHSVVFEILLSK